MNRSRQRFLQRRQALYRAGDHGESMFIVCSGELVCRFALLFLYARHCGRFNPSSGFISSYDRFGSVGDENSQRIQPGQVTRLKINGNILEC